MNKERFLEDKEKNEEELGELKYEKGDVVREGLYRYVLLENVQEREKFVCAREYPTYFDPLGLEKSILEVERLESVKPFWE